MAYSPGEKQWNASEAFLLHLIELTGKSSELAINPDSIGHYMAWYRTLKQMHNLCEFIFDKEDNDKLNGVFGECLGYLDNPAGGKQAFEKNQAILEEKLGEITRLIFRALDKQERIFTKSRFKDWKAEVKEEFK